MADAKTYSRRTLEQILRVVCTHRGEERALKDVLPHLDLKDDGLWLAKRDPNLAGDERKFFEWLAHGNADLPALPIPFRAREFAAFCLDGGGYFVHARFDNGASLDEDALRDLGPNSHEACEVLREAHQMLLEAGKRLGTDDESAPERAQWLLSQPEREPSEPAAVAEAEIDTNMLATRAQMIAAFGAVTGMNATWFDNLSDTPALLRARKRKGRGQRSGVVELNHTGFRGGLLA